MSSSIISISKLGFPWQTQDPFLFCVHHLDYYPSGNEIMGLNPEKLEGRNIGQDFTIKDGWRMYHGKEVPGFPVHPHRGFETITIATQGFIDHSDSLGAAGRFSAGDVQWMTAGKGVQHSEMFPLIHQDKENTTELFQIWLNLPQSKKMVDAHFKMLWREDIPLITETDENGKSSEIRLIAGKFKNHQAPAPAPESWASDADNGVRVMIIKMEPNAKLKISGEDAGLNRSIYFYEGQTINIENQNINSYQKIVLAPDSGIIIQCGDTASSLLLLEGKPINEPVVQHGPFVMNSEEGIRQTMRDFGKTQFGGWPWPKSDNIHNRDKGRFALHADGRLEEPGK